MSKKVKLLLAVVVLAAVAVLAVLGFFGDGLQGKILRFSGTSTRTSTGSDTLSSGSFVLDVSSSPASESYTPGTNVEFTGIDITCKSQSPCYLDSLTVTGYLDDSGTADDWEPGIGPDHDTYLNEYVPSVWLENENGKKISDTSTVGQDGKATFSSVALKMKSESSSKVYIVGNISSDAHKNNDGENIAFGIAETEDVVAHAKRGLFKFSKEAPPLEIRGTPLNEGQGAQQPETYVTVIAPPEWGSLTISVSPDTPKEDIVVAGTDDNLFSVYDFEATDEAFVVKKLAVYIWQPGLADFQLGTNDNNVDKITLSYTNSSGNTETKSGYLSEGNAVFTGLDFYIPADDTAELEIYADLNSPLGGATSGELFDLNLAFNNFEALGQSSGKSFKADMLDTNYSDDEDLDFGNITFVYSHDDIDMPDMVGETHLGYSATFTVDNGHGDADQEYPVGTLVCIDDADGGNCNLNNNDVYVVTDTVLGATEQEITATLINDNGDGAYDDGDGIYVALPGEGYLTSTNMMHVHESKPALSLNSSSPSGSRTVSVNDGFFIIDVEESGDREDIRIRKGQNVDDESDPIEGGFADDEVERVADPRFYIDGNNGIDISPLSASSEGDCFLFDQDLGGDIEDYNYISFWVATNSNSGVNYSDLALILDTDDSCYASADELPLNTTDAVYINGVPVSANQKVGSGNVESFDLVTVALSSVPGAGHSYIGFEILEDNVPITGGEIFFDNVMLHNEIIMLNMISNFDFNTDVATLPIYLKKGGITIAEGYIGFKGPSHAMAYIVPDENMSEIVIPGGETSTFTFETNSAELLDEDAGTDDPLTPYLIFGSASEGVVTPGNFWWYDTSIIGKWTGYNSASALYGNTLRY